MKRKSLLIILLIALFAPLAMSAQQTMTIGSSGGLFSTGNSSTGSFVPGSVMGNTYCYRSLTQFIYTADELGGAKTIKSVAFYHNNGGSFTTQNLTIYLAHTTESTISASTAVTSGTAYYTGTSVTLGGTTEGWQTFTLDTDFEYNGTDNLLVVVARESSSGYKTDQGWRYTSTASNYRYIYRTSDTSGYGVISNGNSTYAYTASYNRPNIQIGFTSMDPFIALTPNEVTVFTGLTKTITANYGNVSGTPTITYTSSDNNVASVNGDGTTATVTGVAPGTATITATLNGTYTATCDITVEDPTYCTPAPTSIDGSGITNVTFGLDMIVDDDLSMSSKPYYYDHSSQIGAAYPGTTVEMSIAYATNYGYYTWVWVDWNKDYEFDDTELVYSPSGTISSGTLAIEFNVPATAALGDYRMRIQGADGSGKKNPCYTGTYSYLVDYTLRVEEAPSCLTPTGLAVVENSIFAHAVTVKWNAVVGENFDYAIEFGTDIDPETVTYTGSITATETTCRMTWNNLTYADSDYTVFIRKNCGNGDYSNAATLVVHTDVACPAPVDFTAVVDGTSVTLTWTGVGTNDIAWSVNPNANPDDYLDPDFHIDGSTGTMTDMSIDTYYYFWVRNNCGGEGYSTWTGPLSVYIGYCLSTFGSNSDCITNITLGDINNSTASSSTDGYGNYADLSTDLQAGEPATLSLTSGSGSGNHGTAVWIDFNDNLEFESSERVGTYNNIQPSTTVEIELTIPYDAAIGSHRMRVKYEYSAQGTAIDPCLSGTSYGEIEDYTVVIIASSNCLRPNNFTVEALWETANLSWNGTSNSYTLQYRIPETQQLAEGSFFDDFENGIDNWTLLVNAEGTGWQTFDATAFQGGSNYSGNYVAMARSYENGEDITADNWMITPQMTIQATMTYWAMNDGRSDHLYDEAYDVCVSTNTNDPSDFVVVQSFTTAPAEWDQITIDLSAYAGLQGYIAFHHHDAEKDLILIDDVFIGTMEIIPAGEWQTKSTVGNETEIELDGLTPNTTYEYQVMGFCDDSESDWSTINTFTTLSGCGTPAGLNAEVTHNTAKLSWEGGSDTYNLQYREVDPTEPATIILTTTDIWGDGSGYQMLLDADATAYSPNPDITDYSIFEYLIPTDAEYDYNTNAFVINNSVSIQIPAGTYDWFITNPSADYSTVYIAASNGNVGGRQDNYVFEAGKTYEFVPSMYGQNDGVDVTITANWTPVSDPVTSPYTLTGLNPETTYEFQVQGIDCDGEGSDTDWSEGAYFTTLEAQTLSLDILGYGTGKGNYYLIAPPFYEEDGINPADIEGMTNGEFDLYYFDQSHGDLEWVNYENTSDGFNLQSGKGYLYANQEDVTLTFTGTPYNGDGVIQLDYDGNARNAGWNLIGNPFTVTASVNRDFYTMNEDGDEIIPAVYNEINAMQGIFVYAEGEGETATFSPVNGDEGDKFVVNISQGRGTIDRAIVRIGEGSELPKFQLNENSTKLAFQQNDKEYAVVHSMAAGELPLTFKAEENGTYTLTVSETLHSPLSTLHLIDHLTGTDVDLLGRGSYSFNATTDDDEARFTLVFRTASNEPEVAQNISLTEGWNWWSTYMEMIGVNGIQLLENSLGDNGLQIKSQMAFVSNSNEGWVGSLNSLNNESMYLIRTNQADDIAISGNVAYPTDHTIYLTSGWNWVGYVQNNILDVNDALANLSASDEDIIKSQSGFATYFNGYGWVGDLQSLQPGHGYMILSDKAASFTYPANAKSAIINAQSNVEKCWKPVIGKFPTNMSVMAVVELNGNELRSEDVELAAFDSNGECRGSAKLMYVKPVDRYVAFLTVQGNNNEPIHFMVRHQDQNYMVSETVTMIVDEVVGTAHNPFRMTLKGAGIGENSTALGIFPNPTAKGQQVRIELPAEMDNATIEIIDVLGRVIYANIVSSGDGACTVSTPDMPGVYTVRVTDAQGQAFHGRLTVK